jgi:hypothetical protein
LTRACAAAGFAGARRSVVSIDRHHEPMNTFVSIAEQGLQA